jgi:hypothetical protein
VDGGEWIRRETRGQRVKKKRKKRKGKKEKIRKGNLDILPSQSNK